MGGKREYNLCHEEEPPCVEIIVKIRQKATESTIIKIIKNKVQKQKPNQGWQIGKTAHEMAKLSKNYKLAINVL